MTEVLVSTFLLSNLNPVYFRNMTMTKLTCSMPHITFNVHWIWCYLKSKGFFLHHRSLQVADGRGNCTPHRNPTPCTIPQDRESIFHSIFAFFTKSGRKVLVNMQPSSCTLTFQRSLTVTPCEDSCFFSQCNICLSHFSFPHTFSCSFPTLRFSF